MAVSKKYIEDRIENGKKFLFIDISHGNLPGMKPNCCPFCDTNTCSGSWSPESCPNCHAVYFFGAWTKNI
jgi:rubrerythrin